MRTAILLDGGMGQELIKRSSLPVTPLWSSEVMIHEADLVTQLHKDYINAGATVITLNTYTATPARLQRDADFNLLEPIHNAAINAARQAIKDTDKPDTRIAACLPPLVASYVANAAPEYQDCLSQYQRIVALQNPAADIFLCETMSNINEAKAAITAAKETNKEVWVSFVLHDQLLSLPSGEPLSLAIEEAKSLGVDSVLLNCCSVETIDNAIPELVALHPAIGAYANAFVDVEPLKPGGTVECLEERHDTSPEAYAEYGIEWINKGAKIIGGCCAIGPAHIKALREEISKNNIQLTAYLN